MMPFIHSSSIGRGIPQAVTRIYSMANFPVLRKNYLMMAFQMHLSLADAIEDPGNQREI
jgi:hypothetical protein